MLGVRASIKGFKSFDFDRRPVKKVLRKQGAEIRKEARKLVSRRALSRVGDYPSRVSGVLKKSIKNRVSRSGFSAIVSPMKTTEMGDDYYPAFLVYGTKRGVKPRKNYMQTALNKRSVPAQSAIMNVLKDSIKARK